MKNRFKNYFAEFLGTAFLVLFGCGTALAVGINAKQGSGYILTAIAFGLILTVMSYSICKKSGCHVNPAVSLAMLIFKKIRLSDFFGYIIAQFSGSFFACGLLFAIFYGHTSNYGANVFYDDNPWISMLIEVILTVVFVVTVLSSSLDEKYSDKGGIISGLALTLVHVMGIQLTGTSVNPARSLAPAIFAGGQALDECWVFIVSPFIGALLAALIYKLIIAESPPKKKKKNKNKNEDTVETEQKISDDSSCKKEESSPENVI